MQYLVDSLTELSTAATDALLAIQAVACLVLLRYTQSQNFRSTLWQALFASLTLGSLLGAIAHAVKMSLSVHEALWLFIYFFLGLTLTILALAAIYDWLGEGIARRLLYWLLPMPLFVVVVTWLGSGEFLYFVIFEALVMLFVLIVYSRLFWQKKPGSGLILTGIIISLVAAAVQASGPMEINIVWLFDHNGLFHLIQMPGVLCFYFGAKMGALDRTGERNDNSEN
jgi:hypothetical protein